LADFHAPDSGPEKVPDTFFLTRLASLLRTRKT
jgi:hypothetical protein